jgi:hypothetical protein
MWERIAVAFRSATKASPKKPPAKMSDTRLEMVMVRRSLVAANAINAGNKISLIRSTIMLDRADGYALAHGAPS